MKIAIVEDDINMRKSLEIAMGDYQEFEIKTFKNAKDALKSLDDTFDLIITDINMPNMDGIELIKALKGTPNSKYTPILVITTESGETLKKKGREAGASGWMTKPFSPDTMIKAVNKLAAD